MSDLPKAFEPKTVEEKLYQFWEEQGFFKASADSPKKPYTIVIPPPNVTGVLHMGHALVDTLQDVLIRWKRMCGFEALWVPGTDHAGIATQAVVERHLQATLGKRRSDFSREEFLGHVWKWKEESERQILAQIKKVGCSCDWSRLAFTMDEQRSRAVKAMFKKMYDEGLIYRGDYLVNWDPVTQTALSDDEVEYEERMSALWFIRYPLEDKSGHVTVATARPETLFGDVAVAVSPDDPRHQHLIGKRVYLPLTDKLIPIIGDKAVDPIFGSGALKITPGHSAVDYEIALRHNLPLVNVLTPDAKLNELCGEFKGLGVEEARAPIAKKLKSLGLLEKETPYPQRVGVSYRSKAVIEPYLSKQWFVRLSQFKPLLLDAVKSGRIKLLPKHFESTYFHWINNLRDWCISRQLWWGHRIPVWYRDGEVVCLAEGEPSKEWVQDSDVLDTWFSAGLWPMSVLGWPDKTPDMEKFYPTSVLVTGHDILFFWVTRMIVMGEYATEKPPFSQVFLHGLIYGKSYWRVSKEGSVQYVTGKERTAYDIGTPLPPDVHSKWEKMSKSKGNILDPLEIIDAYGADAMRMALCASATHARQIDLDRRRFEEFKNFANKIWNGARFVLMNLEDFTPGEPIKLLALEDKWILSLLNRIIRDVNAHLMEYAFDKAALAAYDFFWKEFCAYYVELTKPVLFGKRGTPEERKNKQAILFVILCNSLRLLHPMAPYITEELFQILKVKIPATNVDDPYLRESIQALQSTACIVAPYPKVLREMDIDPAIEEAFASIDTIVHAVRNIRAEMQLPPGLATDLYIIGPKENLVPIQKSEGILHALLKIQTLTFASEEKPLPFSSAAPLGPLKVILPLPLEMREKEKARLTKERDKLVQQQNAARQQLANADFVAKAPEAIVAKLKATVSQAELDLVEISRKIENL
ncbi:MAG: valine--tRNA ligase [Verrucomicrobia bacterium]|nr:valine--tRNA ligase [Verrucomicrobiota bacterium]